MKIRDFSAPSEPVAVAIQTIRRRGNFSQAEFASMIGIKQNTLSQYERGRIKPSAAQIIKLLSLSGRLGRQHGFHPSESLPLTDFLAKELGLSETAIITLIDAEQASLRAQEAKIEARLRELDEEEKRLDTLAAEQNRADNSARKGKE